MAQFNFRNKVRDKKAGANNSTHHLLEIREPGDALVLLRNELQNHPDVVAYAYEGKNFEECLARIGVKLDIALDGEYDPEDLMYMLYTALKAKREGVSEPHKRARGLVDAELEEHEEEVRLVRKD